MLTFICGVITGLLLAGGIRWIATRVYRVPMTIWRIPPPKPPGASRGPGIL